MNSLPSPRASLKSIMNSFFFGCPASQSPARLPVVSKAGQTSSFSRRAAMATLELKRRSLARDIDDEVPTDLRDALGRDLEVVDDVGLDGAVDLADHGEGADHVFLSV